MSYVRFLRNCNLFHAVAYVAMLLPLSSLAQGQVPHRSEPPPLGTLVDVGGYRVHVYCTGQGRPTVMIVGAAFSFDWGLVQARVAKFTRVCTFDPSGTAWSDPLQPSTNTRSLTAQNTGLTPGSTPTCESRVDETHRLITKAPIDGPYILVGFSVGALWARIYAATYPDNITGMVLIDHAFQGSTEQGSSRHSIDSGSAPRGYSPPVLISKAPMDIEFEDDSNFNKLPERDQELHTWALSRHPVRPNYEMVTDCFSRIENVAGNRSYPLGKMPLVVISTTNESPGYTELQTKLLKLSRNSRQVIAWNSSHMIPIDAPEVIVQAIQEVVEDSAKAPVQ